MMEQTICCRLSIASFGKVSASMAAARALPAALGGSSSSHSCSSSVCKGRIGFFSSSFSSSSSSAWGGGRRVLSCSLLAPLFYLKERRGKEEIRGVVCAVDVGRRQACVEMAATLLASAGVLMTGPENIATAGVPKEKEVGTYLKPFEEDPNFVLFRAKETDTPALRAGNVQPYEFVLPPSWKKEKVANILSGNYCQPKCAEPWVECKFADSKQGAILVVAAPMVRLTNKTNVTIDEIGSPENILAALGQFVTGNSFDPEEVTGTSVQRRGDQTYYSYELQTPFARTGAHNLATATAKGSVVMLFVVSASDAQWSSSEKLLRSIANSFSV